MPIYEYQCKACGHRLECLQKFSDQPLTKCPECGKDSLSKCVSLPSFQLKGTGWYETDYKRKKTEEKQDKEKPQKEEGALKAGKDKKKD